MASERYLIVFPPLLVFVVRYEPEAMNKLDSVFQVRYRFCGLWPVSGISMSLHTTLVLELRYLRFRAYILDLKSFHEIHAGHKSLGLSAVRGNWYYITYDQ